MIAQKCELPLEYWEMVKNVQVTGTYVDEWGMASDDLGNGGWSHFGEDLKTIPYQNFTLHFVGNGKTSVAFKHINCITRYDS